MEKQIVRWGAQRVNAYTLRYVLQTDPQHDPVIEIGSYSSWGNPRAVEGSDPVIAALEARATFLGYTLDHVPWNTPSDV